SEMLNEGKFIAIVLINDMDEKMGLARKMLGISSNNEADYAAYVTTPDKFERALRSIFAEHRPGLVTNDMQSQKNKAQLIEGRADKAASSMRPDLRNDVKTRITGGGKNEP
ncbi:MAG TPA: hypothetical protein PKW15_07630, partial [Alphaproteobacteria bacterium]|nr:hypothetical protein [Alphaproteobacteria bacterium]